LPTEEPNEVMCRMSLDLDGILHVAAIEKRSGKAKHITISNALQAKSEFEIAAARKRIQELYASREAFSAEPEEEAGEAEVPGAEAEVIETQRVNGKIIPMDAGWVENRREAVELIQRSRPLLDRMHAEDKEEAVGLHATIESAVARHDPRALGEAVKSLRELLFFVEGS
jgi:molecular chaperone DnaK